MTTQVLVPPLGQTVDTVTLVSWYKHEGDTVQQGEPLFVIETDKANLDIESPASGKLAVITAQAGDVVTVLSSIALIVQPGKSAPLTPSPNHIKSAPPTEQVVGHIKPAQSREGRIFISPRARRLAESEQVSLSELHPTGPEGAIVERDVRAFLEAKAAPSITPVARRVAEESGLDWRTLRGSGPRGQITRRDVSQALESSGVRVETPPVAQTGEFAETIPLSSVRSVIAEHMAHSSSTAASVTLTAEADATALVALRQQLAEDAVPVSYNDLFLYILAHALREHPQLNASLADGAIKRWSHIHIGLATDTDRGLLVPVVHDVDRKGLGQLAQETRTLIERARNGHCTPDELKGGTFTLTNLGMYGIDAFTPIINLPECAILGVGRIKRQPTMVGDAVIGRQMVWLSLTFDHRLVDGGPAARFLQRLVRLVEQPILLMA